MTANPKIDLLKQVPLFRELSHGELAKLATLADEIDVPAGRALTREGLAGKEFVVLAEGIADVERDGEVVATLGPGDYFGEIALVTGEPRTATVTTRSPSRLLVLTAPAFRSLLERTPELRQRVVARAALRLAS
ncbi:MAG: cyclic nucleotide-binding domain-containing protein [Acidobacteriota bacterium]|nr:cyclic nucleotide-binding domain-containing protein [Acidobacteriota bacterium]MDE3189202.1 cyclic nucleotide-binding domain-containing protein [Acidobacteriota bacterium]